MCRTWGSNSEPLACQANTLPIKLPRPAFITVADDNDGAVDVDNGDELFVCLFSNLFIIIIL